MERLANFDFGTRSGAKSAYNWNELLDGGIYKLERGVDYESKEDTLRMLAYKHGKLLGMNVETSIIRNEKKEPIAIVIKGTPASEEDKAKWAVELEEAKAKAKAKRAEKSAEKKAEKEVEEPKEEVEKPKRVRKPRAKKEESKDEPKPEEPSIG